MLTNDDEKQASDDTGLPLLGLPKNIPAIPPKICRKILAGEYLELHPESAWRMEDLMCEGTRQSQRRRPVTDILTWIECFSSMAAIITCKFPEKAPQWFAYQRSIVSASQLFDGPAWVSYDTRYRRKAAISQSFDWSDIDSGLYSECFTGRARVRPTCRICLSESHLDRSCPLNLTTPPNQGQSYRYYQTGSRPWNGTVGGGARLKQDKAPLDLELCGLFNRHTGNECRYTDCKFAHICSLCRLGPHPASRCTRPRRALLSRPSVADSMSYYQH